MTSFFTTSYKKMVNFKMMLRIGSAAFPVNSTRVLSLVHSQQRISAFSLEKWRMFFEMVIAFSMHSFFVSYQQFTLQWEPLYTTIHDMSSEKRKKWRNLPNSSPESNSSWNVKEMCIDVVIFLFIQLSIWFSPKEFRYDFKPRI